MARELPTAIGRYRVERELGRGAMGIIYKAEDPDIGRPVAIKLVRADLLDGEEKEQFLARFRNEARAAGRCSHHNIVSLYDFAIHEGNPFLAMEYVDGVDLGKALKQAGRFSPADAVAIMTQVLDALGAAHALGVVHRDVKPANILVMAGGQVKVTDFGISRIDTSGLTQRHTVIGTPAYMSPEQCRGDTVDARGDLFCVATVLYELLSGSRAFGGRTISEITYQLLTTEPRDVTEVAAGVPPAMAAVLRRAMAKDREDRFPTARAMADALVLGLRGIAPDEASDLADDAVEAAERTVVMPLPRAEAPAPVTPEAPGSLDDETLGTIERNLARRIGPIAKHLVRDAARRTTSVEVLCETVARGIPKQAERERFIAESLGGTILRPGTTVMRTATVAATTASPAAPLSPEQIDRAERALTKAVGPIAKIMVKRAVPGATSEGALWDKLATHIDRPPDRDAFLKQRPAG